MSVETKHPLYIKREEQWQLMRDCIEGEDAIKSGGETYLPKAFGASEEQYESYKKRARFVNFTKRTLEGLHGLVFRRTPVIEKPDNPEIEKILKDIDRQGTSLYQFASDMVYDNMITGWGGILVEYPRTGPGENLLDAERKGYRPYLKYYPAEAIVNWKYGIVNGSESLTLVVLKESWEKTDTDIFSHDSETVYRALFLDNGAYRQMIFRENQTEDKFMLAETIPVSIKNKSLDYIPFIPIPGKLPETPMFLDLAKVNIGHYQKTADYENGVHITTIPTGYITGHNKVINPVTKEEETIALGADQFLVIGEADAKVGVLNYAGEGLTHCETALDKAMSDMAILGSRLVTPEKGSSESADSAKIHRAGENARLATFAMNISKGLSKAVGIIADWIGIEGEITIELCKDYDTLAFDPNALNALANLAEAGKLPLPYVFWNLRNGEYAPDNATLEEYTMLLAMESAGYTPVEIVKAYREQLQARKDKSTQMIMTASGKETPPDAD